MPHYGQHLLMTTVFGKLSSVRATRAALGIMFGFSRKIIVVKWPNHGARLLHNMAARAIIMLIISQL